MPVEILLALAVQTMVRGSSTRMKQDNSNLRRPYKGGPGSPQISRQPHLHFFTLMALERVQVCLRPLVRLHRPRAIEE